MSPAPGPLPLVPAHFLHRCAAWSLDMAVVGAVALAAYATRLQAGATRIAAAFDTLAQSLAQATLEMVMHGGTPLELARRWLADPRQRADIAALADAAGDMLAPSLLLAAVLAFAWWVLFESSPLQATPGKRLLGLRVADLQGARLGLPRATLRHLAGTLSWLSLNIGHLLALAPPQHQALHDRIAGARVLQRAHARLPAWAVAWLVLLALAALVATGWAVVAMQAAMQRAFDALL